MTLCFTICQVCEETSVGRTTVYAAIKDGHLRARKVGRRTVILKDDVESWLQGCPVASKKTSDASMPGDGK